MRKRAIVAIVGRPNVGKSTLFNRLAQRQDAVVHDVPGVTRDRHYETVTWNDVTFDIVDTGGLMPKAIDGMDALVRQSALAAIDEADLLMVMSDVTVGITDLDQEIARLINKVHKPCMLLVNKADSPKQAMDQHQFYKLGLGEPFAISALHGAGVGDLLDRMVQEMPDLPGPPPSDADLRLALIGKPNVGKSSLLNALLGEERVLVSEVPGTTRDSIDSRLRWHGHEIDIVDTAGLRKRSRLSDVIDVYSSLRTLRSLERCDVCLLMLDATEKISVQDTRIAGYAHNAGRGIVVIFNKWDAIEKDTHTIKTFQEEFEREFAFIRYAPILTISATEKQRIHRVMQMAWDIGESRQQELVTSQLNNVLEAAFRRNPPHFFGGGNGQVKYGVQISTAPPRFAVYVNNPKFFDRNYIRFLNNSLRRAFPFPGTAMRIELRASTPRRGSKERP